MSDFQIFDDSFKKGKKLFKVAIRHKWTKIIVRYGELSAVNFREAKKKAKKIFRKASQQDRHFQNCELIMIGEIG